MKPELKGLALKNVSWMSSSQYIKTWKCDYSFYTSLQSSECKFILSATK